MEIPENKSKPGPKGGAWGEVIKRGIMIGRNAVVVPPDEVEHLAQLGCTDAEIARYFGVKEDTLRRHFETELAHGRHNLKTTLRQAQLRVALEGNPTMLIWLGKNLLSQNESGQGSDEKRPLPWSDNMDDEVEDTDDLNHTQVLEDSDADTET
jgi:hypothetical protein